MVARRNVSPPAEASPETSAPVADESAPTTASDAPSVEDPSSSASTEGEGTGDEGGAPPSSEGADPNAPPPPPAGKETKPKVTRLVKVLRVAPGRAITSRRGLLENCEVKQFDFALDEKLDSDSVLELIAAGHLVEVEVEVEVPDGAEGTGGG